MTEVLLVSRNGEFCRCSASGHAGFAAKGKDVVCAAESAILGTALDLLENTEGIKVTADTASRGNLDFSAEVLLASDLLSERLRCTADFIRHGIQSVARQYPECVIFNEQKLN